MWRCASHAHTVRCELHADQSSIACWATALQGSRLPVAHRPYRDSSRLGWPCTARLSGPAAKSAACHSSSRAHPSCRATDESSDSSTQTTSAAEEEKADRIQQTLAGLDALLGIEEDKPSSSDKKETEDKQESAEKAKVEVAPEIYKALAEAEAERRKNNGKSASTSSPAETEEDMKSILDAARKLGETAQSAQKPGADPKEFQAIIKDEMEKLMDRFQPGLKQDMKKIREEVFGPNIFWVTDMQSIADRPSEFVPGSWLVRGNLRTDKDAAFEKITQGVEKLFEDKYAVFMVPDPEAELQPPEPQGKDAKERVAFVVALAKFAQPQEAPAWQAVVAAVLFLLSIGTATQIGLAANVTRFLPQSIIELLSRPDSFQADSIPPELNDFDFVPLLVSSVPISSAIVLLQIVQELAHRFVANSRQVKLGTPIFIPNGQIGLFGSVTQLKSLVRNRKDLFDISVAGPLASGGASLAIFLTGLALSGGSAAREDLLPVPAALLQGSLLLGGATRAALGLGVSSAASTIAVHPLVIGGWCGLVATALNCLPVGCIDGGRIVQAAFGRKSLGVSSFFTYVALGLGLLGSSLALPFGIYVFICQRTPEAFVQDTVTAPGGSRNGLALGLLALSVLILLPALTGLDTAGTTNITL